MADDEQGNHDIAADNDVSVRADEPKTCANCGEQIDTTEWHPLVTRTDTDGNFQVFAFCNEDCRDEWTE